MKKMLHRDEKNTSFQHYTQHQPFCENISSKIRAYKKNVFLSLR